MSKKKSEWYITSEQIHNEWSKWKQSGVMSETMGRYMLEVSTHLLGHARFVRYPQYMKDEMVQEGVLKIIKNLKNMKEEYASSFFNYWTRCCWTAFVVYLGNHYKQLNLKRKLIVDALEQVKQETPCSNDKVINHLRKELDEYESSESQMVIED